MRTLLKILLLSILSQTLAYACICPNDKNLKTTQEREFENSNSILIVNVLKVDKEAGSFSFEIVEVLKGTKSSIKIMDGIYDKECGPSVYRTGKWLVYGNLSMNNTLSINPCGLTRSFDYPEYNVFAGHKPPPPPPYEPSTLEERNKHQEMIKKWKENNIAPAKKNLEEEINSLRNKIN